MMKTKTAFWMLAAFAAFASFGATTPMASQPWVKMTVSNAVNEAKEETKQWTKDYIKWGGESPEVVKGEGMAWFEGGTNLCYMRNGVVRRIRVKSSRTERQTAGFLVLNCFNVSSVSNGMTFAWVGGKDFKCATSKGIPIITEVNPQTNEVDGVEYVYRKFKITETIETSPGYSTTVEWDTVQVSPSVWKCYRTGGAEEGYEYKEFYLRECSVSAIEGTPEEPRASLGFFGTLAELIFPSCRADGIDVVGGGGSYSLVIELDGQNPAYFTLSFKGQAKPLLPDPPKEDWEEEKGDKKIIHHYKWNPNPAFTKEDWCNPNLWIDSIYIVEIKVENPFSPTGYDIDYFRITGGGVLNYIGAAFSSELANSYIEPEIVEWTEEEDLECKDGIHEFASNNDTCVCNRCGKYNRHHHMVNVSGDCMKCDKPHGKEKENGKLVSSYGGTCGGREKGRAYHRGWKADPFTEMGSPYPNGRGNTMSCTCLCGYYVEKDDMKHEFGDYFKIYAGDEFGRDQNDVHTKVYKCEYCGNAEKYGWRAEVEAHKIDPQKAGQELSPECFVSEKEAVKVTPPTRYPDDREQPADLSWHMAIGECDDCHEDVETYFSPHVFQNCVCKCGMTSHKFESIDCPNAAHCTVCNKWFYRDNDGYVHLDKENLDEHLFGGEQSQIWNGDVPDLVKHICHCGKRTQGDTDKSYQQHHWSEDDDDEKYCCDPDTPTKDGNNNWIHGCGIKYHTQETCPMNQAIGDCEGGWTCLICGRDLNADKDGNPAPNVHGNINHGKPGSESAKTHYGSQTIDDVFHCAVCKHTWLGAQCGTTVETTTDAKGHIKHKKKYVGTVLTDPQLHIGWKESEDSGRYNHDCRCRQLNETLGHHRSHNWGTMTCEQIPGDLFNHKTSRWCDYKDYQGTPTFDNCVKRSGVGAYKDTFEEGHSWRNNTSGQLYSNVDGECKKNVICRVYDSHGDDVGCHMTKQEDAVHDWHTLSWFGLADVYHCGTGSDSEKEKCYMTERCEHGPKDKAMTNERLGCGAQRYDEKYVSHKKKYNSTYLDEQKHRTRATCENNCGYLDDKENNHNHAESGYTNINSATHTHYTKCVKNFSVENPGCGNVFYDDPENHNRAIVGWKPDGNDWHESDLYCSKCRHNFGTTNEHHQGWYNPGYAESYSYVGKLAMPAGDTMAHHIRHAKCYKCEPENGFPYTVDEICEYEWVGGWKCQDDADYDIGTCYWCKTETRFAHQIRPNYFFASAGHSCYHTFMNRLITGSVHFDEPHTEENPCTVCGWERHHHADCDSCGCCSIHDGEVSGCDYWDWFNDKCGCEYCAEGKGDSCACGGEPYDPTWKWTAPFVFSGQFIRAFVFSGYEDIDMFDPVYEVGSRGFEEAFLGSYALGSVNCGAITNVQERGFKGTFTDCFALSDAHFGNLVNARERSFECAFSNCDNLGYIDLGNLELAEEDSFKSAFHGCVRLPLLSLPKLREIGRGAFEANNEIVEVVTPKATNIGERAFADCGKLQYVYFSGSEEIPALENADAFSGLREGAAIIVPGDLYEGWKAATNWNDISEMIISDRGYGTNCDFYVSARIGSDAYDGLTPDTPKRTIDGAIAVATTNQVIGVMDGHYAYPEFFAANDTKGSAYPVTVVGLADNVYIDKHNSAGYGYITGCTRVWTAFENIHFKNFDKMAGSGKWGFLYTYFYNCTFEDSIVTQSHYRGVWTVSVLERCKVKNVSVIGRNGDGSNCKNLNPVVFCDCIVYDSEIEIDTPNHNPGAGNLSFSNVTHFDNAFVKGGDYYSLELYEYLESHNFGEKAEYIDSTFIPDSAQMPEGWGDHMIPITLTNCLAGVDGLEENPDYHFNSIIRGRDEMDAAIDPATKRPDSAHSSWRAYGYRGLPMMFNRSKGKRKSDAVVTELAAPEIENVKEDEE